MSDLPNNIKVESLEKSFIKYKTRLLDPEKNINNVDIKKEQYKILFLEYLLFHTYLFYKRNNFLQEFGNQRYESIPYDLKNIDTNLRMTEQNFKDNYESAFKLTRWEKTFLINPKMLNFCFDFIQNKLFDIPQSFEAKIEELAQQLPNNDAEIELKEITKETMQRIESAKGFYKIIKLSNNNIKQFHTLIQMSMVQFYNNLPTDNPIYDRTLKNALNVIKPNLASGYNKQVAKAVESAKKQLNVKFSYESFNSSDKTYPLYSIDLIPHKYEENTERRIEKMLEIIQHIPTREYKKDNWRPFTSKTLVWFLRDSALELGGYVFIFEIKAVLKKFLNRASNNIPLNKLISQYVASSDGSDIDILDYQEAHMFSGEQIEFDNYEIQFDKFILPILNSNIISSQDLIRYSSILQKQLNSIKVDKIELNVNQNIEFFSPDLHERIKKENANVKNLHKKFTNFINKLDDPIYLEEGVETILNFYFNLCKSLSK